MTDESWTLSEAAEFLKLSKNGLRIKARSGEVPAAKVGTKWLFSRDLLIEWLQTKSREPKCSIKEKIVETGTRTLHSTKSEYAEALELVIND